jgi:hypothetical protein
MSCESLDMGRIPYFNQDIQDEGTPESVKDLREKIRTHDAVLIATSEYDYAVPGVLTAALDWALRSRYDRTPFRHKPVGIVGASSGGGGQHPLAARWHIEGRKSKGHGSAYEPWDLLDGIKAPAIYVLWRGTSYRRSTFPEPSHVRVSMSRRVTAGCSSKTGVPAPNTTGPIIRCSSSTRSFASKSFQSVRPPNTKMSLPG